MLAQELERKIIIENNQFYYTTIDSEFQVATLFTGLVTESMKSAKSFAIPAGRNYAEPIIPFSWDLCMGSFYGINFLSHPLNDRFEALKKFPIASLEMWSDKIKPIDLILKSVDQNMYTNNAPYQAVLAKSSILNDFFFDAIAANDSSYFVAICNDHFISIWNYDGKKWTHGQEQKFPFTGYFTLTKTNNKLFLITGQGQIYSIQNLDLTVVKNKSLSGALSDYTIVENRDEKSIYVFKNKDLNFSQPFDKLLSKKAIKLL